MTSTTTTPLVVYQHLVTEDIHALTFVKASRLSSEQGMDLVMDIFNQATPETTIRLLLDFRATGLLPMNNILSQGRLWRTRVKVHPPTRMAMLMPPAAVASLLQPIFGLLRFSHLQTQIFQGDEHEGAVRWLQQPQ